MRQIGIFDESNCLKKLSALGDPLEKLNCTINLGMFEDTLNKVFVKEQKGVGGRPPYSYLRMFKILILDRENLRFAGFSEEVKCSWSFYYLTTLNGSIKVLG